MKKFLAFLVLSYIMPAAIGQQTIPCIQASSKKIKILDDDFMQDGELVPGLNPDTYVFHPAPHPKKLAYYTDKDSLVFWVKAGDSIDFAIVLNGKDTCYQRVTSDNPNKVQYASNRKGELNDTLPFVPGPNNAIHLKGRINGSETLDLIFDTGASIGVLSEEGKARQAALRSDNKNVFQMGAVTISQSPATYIDYRGSLKADGVVGYNAFEGKVVEINYDKNIMVIHHDAYNAKGYAVAEMKWRGSAMFMEGTIETGSKKCKGLFLFDTGSKWALSLNRAFAAQNNLYGTMKAIGTVRAKGVDGRTVKSDRVQLPALYLGGLLLLNVPADIEQEEQSEGSLAFNILGNDVLKRFNVILDYNKGLIYLKPNSLQQAPYTKTFDEKDILLIAVLVAVAMLLALLLYRKAKRRRQQRPG